MPLPIETHTTFTISSRSDAETLKDRLRDTLAKNRLPVADYYHTEGFCQHVARAQWFENGVLVVIAFNALWIWIDVDYNKEASLLDAHPVFIGVEVFLCVFFCAEWFIRFMAFRRKCDTRKDAWFVFDSLLVGLMVTETTVLTIVSTVANMDFGSELGNASVLRLLRLLRLTRLGKLMAYIPEVLILVRGMAEGMRSVGLTMLLLAVVIYVVAVALTQLTRDSVLGDQYFKTVPEAMFTLLVDGMVPDVNHVMGDFRKDSVVTCVFLLFVCFSTFTILNMLIGILCEVVTTVKEREQAHMDMNFLKSSLQRTMQEEIDVDQDGLVSKAEFLDIIEKPAVIDVLTKLGFDVIGLVDHTELIFGDDDGVDEMGKEIKLTFDDFITLLMQSRESCPATQKDIRELRKYMQNMFQTNSNRSSRADRSPSGSQRGRANGEDASEISADAANGEEPNRFHDDSITLSQGLKELGKRLDALEAPVALSLEGQRELAHRMASLERLVTDVANTQQQLVASLPSLELLATPRANGSRLCTTSKDKSGSPGCAWSLGSCEQSSPRIAPADERVPAPKIPDFHDL